MDCKLVKDPQDQCKEDLFKAYGPRGKTNLPTFPSVCRILRLTYERKRLKTGNVVGT
jgi:hypothetical protein